MKTIKQLASEIAKKEGKKSNVKIGDVREILSILSDMIYDEMSPLYEGGAFTSLYQNGKRRAKRKK